MDGRRAPVTIAIVGKPLVLIRPRLATIPEEDKLETG